MNIHVISNQLTIKSQEKQNILLFLGSKLISMFGTYIYEFALSLYILKVTKSGTSFALGIIMGTLPNVILSPFSGSIADRIDRKKLTITLDILSGIVIFLQLFISSIYGFNVYHIYAATFILSVINNFYDVALGSSIPNLVSNKSLMKINSYNQSIDSIASLLCPVIGGAIYGLVPLGIFLTINGISFFAAALMELFINFNINKSSIESPVKNSGMSFKILVTDVKEGLSFIKENKVIYSLLKYVLIMNFFFNAAFSVSNTYILNNVIMVKPWQFGIIQSALSIGILLASVLMGIIPEKNKKLKGLSLSLSIMSISIIAVGFSAISIIKSININILFIYFILVFCITGIFIVTTNVPIGVLIQRLTPDNIRGRVNGVRRTLAMGLSPIGIILAGVALDIMPAYILNFLCGGATLILSIAMYKDKNMQDL